MRVDIKTFFMYMTTLRRIASELGASLVAPSARRNGLTTSAAITGIRNPEAVQKRGRPNSGADVTKFNTMIKGKGGRKKLKGSYTCSNCDGPHRITTCKKPCKYCTKAECQQKGEACRRRLKVKADSILRSQKRGNPDVVQGNQPPVKKARGDPGN